MTNPDLEDALRDLLDRLETAEVNLITLADTLKPTAHERLRLEGKANGVRLAGSYVKEELTRARTSAK